MGKRGKEFAEFKGIIRKIAEGETLEAKYRDHVLAGQYKGTRECHIEPDWLLVYELTESELVLVRTGTHSDLFK
jgi:mRNA interferase YafQ